MSRLPVLLFAVLAFPALSAAAPAMIAEEDFVCHGRSGRSVEFEGKTYDDCAGGHLPSGGARPELVRLLNKFRDRVGRPVKVTSGYRCDAHNAYSWAFVAKETGDREGVSPRSLHRAGAAADFYVDGARDAASYDGFERELKAEAKREGLAVWTRVYGAKAVRDPDNRHEYPYIHVHLAGASRRAAAPGPVKE